MSISRVYLKQSTAPVRSYQSLLQPAGMMEIVRIFLLLSQTTAAVLFVVLFKTKFCYSLWLLKGTGTDR